MLTDDQDNNASLFVDILLLLAIQLYHIGDNDVMLSTTITVAILAVYLFQ